MGGRDWKELRKGGGRVEEEEGMDGGRGRSRGRGGKDGGGGVQEEEVRMEGEEGSYLRGHKNLPTYNLIPVQNDRVYNELCA